MIEEALGKHFRGLMGHSGWAPYDKWSDATHQQCLAHLITHGENKKFQAHLGKRADELLTFLYEDVEATNWPAEQAIRPAVRFWGFAYPQGVEPERPMPARAST